MLVAPRNRDRFWFLPSSRRQTGRVPFAGPTPQRSSETRSDHKGEPDTPKSVQDTKALPAPVSSSEKHVPPLARRHRHHHSVLLFCSSSHGFFVTLSVFSTRPPQGICSAEFLHSASHSSVCFVHMRMSPSVFLLFLTAVLHCVCVRTNLRVSLRVRALQWWKWCWAGPLNAGWCYMCLCERVNVRICLEYAS